MSVIPSYDYIVSTGIILPDTSSILADVQQEYIDTFGNGINLAPTTPQGVLITAETLSRTSVADNNAQMANLINPNLAGGTALDAIMALTGIGRVSATQTLVTAVTLTGVQGTVISAGAQASTAAGDIFVSLSTVTLPSGGSITVNFSSQVFGPIPCAIGALNQIVSSVLGWETINNTVAGIPGISEQSDQAARAYRNNTLGFQGVALPIAITSALYETAGVTSLAFLENYYSVPNGELILITGGTTLSGQTWGMTTLSGSGAGGTIIIGTDAQDYAVSLQNLPTINPWPVAAFSTTGNITLSGLSTQSGGDWSGSLTTGQIILVKNQTTASQNGLWVAESGAWTRQSYNLTGSAILGSNQGISMVANSIYTCVNGGSDTDVASALLENKSSGCAWNGNDTVALVEPASGQTYNVQFDRPTVVNIVVQVTTTNGNAANITQAVLDYAEGNINGLVGFIVGADVSPFEIAGAIMSENPSYYISNVQVALDISSPPFSTNVISIGENQIAATTAGLITVIIA